MLRSPSRRLDIEGFYLDGLFMMVHCVLLLSVLCRWRKAMVKMIFIPLTKEQGVWGGHVIVCL